MLQLIVLVLVTCSESVTFMISYYSCNNKSYHTIGVRQGLWEFGSSFHFSVNNLWSIITKNSIKTVRLIKTAPKMNV